MSWGWAGDLNGIEDQLHDVEHLEAVRFSRRVVALFFFVYARGVSLGELEVPVPGDGANTHGGGHPFLETTFLKRKLGVEGAPTGGIFQSELQLAVFWALGSMAKSPSFYEARL